MLAVTRWIISQSALSLVGDYLWQALWKNIKYGPVFHIFSPHLSGKQYLIVKSELNVPPS